MKNKVVIGVILCLIFVGGFVLVKDPFHFYSKSSDELNIDNNGKMQNKDDNKVAIDEMVGKWDAISAVNVETSEKIDHLKDIFGSSYSQYGSYLELKEDGTFLDAIEPITDGSKANNGTYEIKRNYNKSGDCYVFLSYSDGTTATLQRVFLDESDVAYLVLENFIQGYQFTLKKS